MSRKSRQLPLSLVASLLLLSPAAVAAESAKIRPDYPRYERSRAAATRPPQNRGVPEELRVERPSDPAPAARGRGERASRDATDVERAAASAGRSAALETFRTSGRREYYRAGLFDGLHDALDDARLARRARHEGEVAGRHDLEARASGAAAGIDEARSAAAPEARLQVEEQFRDLEREPLYRPRYRTPAYDPPSPQIFEPTLHDVFVEVSSEGIDRGHDPWKVYGFESRAALYDDDWASPGRAFDSWCRGTDRSIYFRLSESDRNRFERAFRRSFSRALAEEYESHGRRAYRRGFDNGWTHGAYVHEEWAFRLGFFDGFRAAFRETARDSFHRSYGESFESAYARVYDAWSLGPKFEIAETRLLDGNADGVFEPGESLRVRYDLVNYGGHGGRATLRLTGEALADPVRQSVDVARRSLLADAGTIQAVVAPTTPARTDTRLSLQLDRQTRRMQLRVGYPLEIDRRDVQVVRDDIAGELLVRVSVTNRSLLPVDAAIELHTATLPEFRDARELPNLEPGATTRRTFAVTGLDPLDLMAGRTSLDLEVVRDDAVRDRLVYHLPDAVRDLGDRTLLRYMVELAEAGRFSRAQVRSVHELLMLRLREDWKVAVIGNGNPYKVDYKKGATNTALGDLVRTLGDEGPALRHPEVFAGLRTEVTDLARSMPGYHPFLRKSMRRLASRLP